MREFYQIFVDKFSFWLTWKRMSVCLHEDVLYKDLHDDMCVCVCGGDLLEDIHEGIHKDLHDYLTLT